MSSTDLNTLKQRLRNFAEARDWDQFHSPKNLSMALSAEVAEIVEHFQWLTEEQSKSLTQNKLEEVGPMISDENKEFLIDFSSFSLFGYVVFSFLKKYYLLLRFL